MNKFVLRDPPPNQALDFSFSYPHSTLALKVMLLLLLLLSCFSRV